MTSDQLRDSLQKPFADTVTHKKKGESADDYAGGPSAAAGSTRYARTH